MTRLRNFVIGCALSAASMVTSIAPAMAVPLSVPDIKVEQQADVQKVWHNGRRHYNRDRYYGHRRHHRPGFSVYIAPRPVYRDRYVRRGGYSAHVNWCLQRYRSYDPGSNRFLAYGGVYKVCRSPYR